MSKFSACHKTLRHKMGHELSVAKGGRSSTLIAGEEATPCLRHNRAAARSKPNRTPNLRLKIEKTDWRFNEYLQSDAALSCYYIYDTPRAPNQIHEPKQPPRFCFPGTLHPRQHSPRACIPICEHTSGELLF
ncbi:hypothetical protein AFLA_009670 [Aspergillus flavus NRRL3357]|nr:hypothetical protein AFLA_009670 [Aspergillus flavus NRRL3357]